MPPRSARATANARDRIIAKKKAKCGDPSQDGSPPFLSEQRINEIRYNLRSRATYPSRFYHQDDMVTIGADGPLQTMFTNIGWRQFLTKAAVTYECLTIDFLQSYAYDLILRVVTFTFQNVPYQLTFDEVNAAMGVDLSFSPLAERFSNSYLDFKKAAKTQFWHYLTNDPDDFDSHKRDYRIIHPIWILAHRILSASLTNRREAGQVNATEIFVLYCMYKKIPVDFCDFFLEKCDMVRGRPSGDIGVGGLVTLIAVHVGFDFEQLQENPRGTTDTIYLTLKVLEDMSLIRRGQNSGYEWLTGTEADPKAKFPCLKITPRLMGGFKFNNKKTWKPEYQFKMPEFGRSIRERGQSSRGGGDNDDDDEEMEEGGGGDEDDDEMNEVEEEEEEEDTIPLNVYRQMARLSTQSSQHSRDIQEMQRNQRIMMQQTHDMWSLFRPPGGYPIYPPYQPPPGGFTPYQPPTGGYAPFRPPPGDYTYYQPPPGGYYPDYQPPPGGPSQ